MNAPSGRLHNFPISWFSVIMGLTGSAIAWTRAGQILGFRAPVGTVLLGLSAALFALFTLLYAAKAVRYGRAVLAEVVHPVKLAFVPTFSIGLLLLSIGFLHPAPLLSRWLWTIGTLVHFALTLYVLSSWVHHRHYEISHLNPAWFIPVVGNILIPIAGIHHAPADLSWFFFSLGLFFWPVLTAILFYRLIFHGSLPERFIPTLFIFIAPPAVGFISWYNLAGTVDAFGRILYFIALAFLVLLLSQAGFFARLRFYLSWWAYSFPLAAVTIATLLMARTSGAPVYFWLARGLLALLSVVIVALVALTIRAVIRREICVDGH